jgi:hypothetical protein
MSGLKDKLEKAVVQEKERQAKHDEAVKRYVETVNREFPRLCKELADRVKALVSGIKDVSVEEKTLHMPLTQFSGNSMRTVTEVDVPAIAVSLQKHTIAFIPEGINRFGVSGAIQVQNSRDARGLGDPELIFMCQDASDSTKWVLASNPSGGKRISELTRLTDEYLEALIERALIGSGSV